jgi:hypothetical protein
VVCVCVCVCVRAWKGLRSLEYVVRGLGLGFKNGNAYVVGPLEYGRKHLLLGVDGEAIV